MEKPKKHCDIGTYKHTVPMSIKNKVQYIDFCIMDLVSALNAGNLPTLCSCCGHGKNGEIILEDGRILKIDYNKKKRAGTPSRRQIKKYLKRRNKSSGIQKKKNGKAL